MNLTNVYAQVSGPNGPGPLVARLIIDVLITLQSDRITSDEAAVAIEDTCKYPYSREGRTPAEDREFLADHPEIVRARLSDPAFRQWMDWYKRNMTGLNVTTQAVMSGDPDFIDRAWKD